MTDRELIDACNRWAGEDTGNPLRDWNDLVRLMPRVLAHNSKAVYILMRPAICIHKNFEGVPRKVLELIAEWEKGNTSYDGREKEGV